MQIADESFIVLAIFVLPQRHKGTKKKGNGSQLNLRNQRKSVAKK
jgi:hypothetical protein